MALYVTATPIGNLEDVTLRALRVLKEADYVLCEDTRRTGILLSHFEIKGKKLVSLQEHNEERKIPFVLKDLADGKNIVLVTDSGTPAISDPGFKLIRECIRNSILVIPIPGPNAALSALIASGFATDSFVFYGFVPKKEKARKEFFERIKENGKTAIIYESPYRLVKALEAMKDIMPERKVCVCREMTKKFEEFVRGNADEVYNMLKGKEVKGEITIVLDKA